MPFSNLQTLSRRHKVACEKFISHIIFLQGYLSLFPNKPVAPAGCKNKQYRYALRQSASVSRFLYPAKGYGDLKTDSLTNFQVTHDTLPKAVLRKQRSLCAAGTFSHRT